MKDGYTYEDAENVLNEYLKKKKLRKTSERHAILKWVHNSDGHFLAETIYDSLNKEYRVSLGTIYNTLELLQACHLVQSHQFFNQPAQYEKTMGEPPHYHSVCTQCGEIKEFVDKKIKFAIQARKMARFEMYQHAVYLYGLCKKCKNSRKKRK